MQTRRPSEKPSFSWKGFPVSVDVNIRETLSSSKEHWSSKHSMIIHILRVNEDLTTGYAYLVKVNVNPTRPYQILSLLKYPYLKFHLFHCIFLFNMNRVWSIFDKTLVLWRLDLILWYLLKSVRADKTTLSVGISEKWPYHIFSVKW